jgi:glycosyltransferase involved in cell wall biosynthesis
VTHPLISVVIPAFNREHYLADALASVVSQGHVPLEVIVVDDGSMDGTVAVAHRFPDVRCISRTRGGAAAARNTGVAAARGEFVAFLDSDDVWADGKIARQIEALGARPDAQMAFGWVQHFVSPEAPEAVRTRVYCPPEPGPGRCCGTLLVTRNTMDRIGPFDETLGAGEFIEWYSRARGAGTSEVMVEQIVLHRRLHGGNLGYQQPELRLQIVQAVGKHLRRQRESRNGN